MTYEEAIDQLNNRFILCPIDCAEDCEACRIEAVQLAIKALKKQTPKLIRSIYSGRYYRCPVCNEQVAKKQNYCEFCGQKLSEV